MEWLPAHALTILAGGSVIGFLLGLLGGGGSLLAVPMLLHIGGMTSPHMAIGTSAVAVALNAYLNAFTHARYGNVMWRPALIFSAIGGLTAIGGAVIGLHTPGPWLMMAFGVLTLSVGIWMWTRKPPVSDATVIPSDRKTLLAGLGVGGLAGFFGIGGGFMVVPSMLWATGMDVRKVMGTSLVGVGTLGMGAALTYALAGEVQWVVAGLLLLGGFFGGRIGHKLGEYLHGKNKAILQKLFAAFIILVGVWVTMSHLIHG